MKKTIAMIVSAAFLFGATGFALAQTPAPAEKKADDKAMEKKPAPKKMTLDERKAACIEKAGADDAKKTQCEKRYAATKAKMEKKMEKMEKMEKKDAAPAPPAPEKKQ
jgi:hypothetical protein